MSYSEDYEIPVVKSTFASLVANYRPAQPKVDVTPRKWKLGDIKDPNNSYILVLRPNPKQSGCDAHLLWDVQGEVGKPTVTVTQFLTRGAEMKSERNGHYGPLGSSRVRSDLVYNLSRGWVTLGTVTATRSSNCYAAGCFT